MAKFIILVLASLAFADAKFHTGLAPCRKYFNMKSISDSKCQINNGLHLVTK